MMRPSVLSVLLLLAVASAWPGPGWEDVDNQPSIPDDQLAIIGVMASVFTILFCIALCSFCYFAKRIWANQRAFLAGGGAIHMQVQPLQGAGQHQPAGYNIHPGQVLQWGPLQAPQLR